MADKFGLPESMFGFIDDDFAGALGRVAMVGALVESKLDMLVASLDNRTQSHFAGEPIARQLATARKLLRGPIPARPSLSKEERKHIGLLLDQVEAVMWQRNEVLHSVWPQPNLSAGLGWRHLPAKQRPNDVDWTKTYGTTVVLFTTLLRQLVECVNDLQSTTQGVESHARVSVPDAQD
jgi:hypothetical protein